MAYIYYNKTKVANIGDSGNISFNREGIENCGMPPQWIPHIKKLMENSLPEGFRRDALVQLAAKSGTRASLALELVPYVSEWPGRFSVGDDSFAERESTHPRSFCQLPETLPQGGHIKIESRLPVSFFDPLSEQRINTKPSFSGYQDKFTAVLRMDSDGVWTLAAPVQEAERGNVIVKPAHPRYPFIAENEYLCMALAEKAGLCVPRVFLFRQPGITLEPQHIAIERFDVKAVSGKPVSLDISEFAPLMDLEPQNKYGATTEQLFDYAGSVLSSGDMRALANAYLFGYIVRNGDMHSKNFSLEYKEGKYTLSPVYDMVNTAVYGDYTALALSLGGENSPKPSKITRFLSDYLSAEDFESMAMSVKSSLKECSERAFAETSHKNAPKFQKKLEQSISEGVNHIREAVKTQRNDNGGKENSPVLKEAKQDMNKKNTEKNYSAMTNEELYKEISLFMPPDKQKEFLEELEKRMKDPDSADELMSLALGDKARIKHFNELLHINRDKLSAGERQFGESFLRVFSAHEEEERKKFEVQSDERDEEKPIERYSLSEERREEKERQERAAGEQENGGERARDLEEEIKEPEEYADARLQSSSMLSSADVVNARVTAMEFLNDQSWTEAGLNTSDGKLQGVANASDEVKGISSSLDYKDSVITLRKKLTGKEVRPPKLNEDYGPGKLSIDKQLAVLTLASNKVIAYDAKDFKGKFEEGKEYDIASIKRTEQGIFVKTGIERDLAAEQEKKAEQERMRENEKARQAAKEASRAIGGIARDMGRGREVEY